MSHDTELDEIYRAIDALFRAGCFDFVDWLLEDKTGQVWRTEVVVLVGYATITAAAKSKLPHREMFLAQCKRYYPDPKLWQGLD
jgi:hypothetical protein